MCTKVLTPFYITAVSTPSFQPNEVHYRTWASYKNHYKVLHCSHHPVFLLFFFLLQWTDVGAQNSTTLNGPLVTAIEFPSMQLVRHTGHDVRWVVTADSSAEPRSMFAVVVKRFANRRSCYPGCVLKTQILFRCEETQYISHIVSPLDYT